MKIAICGLIKSENIGEQFIARSLEYLIETEARKRNPDIDIEFVEVDLLGRNDEVIEAIDPLEKRLLNYYGYKESGLFMERANLKLKRMWAASDNQLYKNLIARSRHSIWKHGANFRKRMRAFFNMRLEGVDFIVVDGAGLLEYSYNEYHWALMLISEYAEKHGLNVVYNAIGRAGAFNEKDFGTKTLKRALQSDAVKYVSARDSVETVQICAGDKHKVKLLADAAFWMKETYDMKPAPENNKIGIGLIRGNSLTGYGVDFNGKAWTTLFAGIATELEKRGYEYEFFTNGLPGDVKLGEKVLKRMGLPPEKLVKRPLVDTELYDTINGYKALVTCRMHSSIAAFTMKIPAVILSWNDKVDKLMDIIGYPDRAIPLSDFEPVHIVDMMEKAINEGVSDEKLNAIKAKSLESVDDYIDLILEVGSAK